MTVSSRRTTGAATHREESEDFAGARRPPGVEIHGLVKQYRAAGVRALDGLDLRVEAGEWVAITGPSGSGKSTLLALCAALDEPDAGTIAVGGQDLRALRDIDGYRRRVVGLVFQLHNLLPHLDARRNVEIAMFGTRRSRSQRGAHADALLTEMQLGDKAGRRPPELSGGERQRVAIARALANDPLLLLADEPTGSLDPSAVERTVELFRRLRTEHGTTILMVTHDEGMAQAADRMVTLRDGRILD